MPSYAFKNNTVTFDAVQEYFAHLNPLAQRIASDINATKMTYGQLWHAFNPNEQANIINETLIKPEISLKYFDYFSASSISLPSSNLSTSSSCVSTLSVDHILQHATGGSTSEVLRAESAIKELMRCDKQELSKRLVKEAVMQPPQIGSRGLKPPSSPPPPPPINPIKALTSVSVTTTNDINIAAVISTPAIISATRPKKTGTPNNAKGTNDMQNFYAYDGRNLPTYFVQKVALKIIYDDVVGSYRDEHSRPFSYRTKSQINLSQQQKLKSATGDEETFMLDSKKVYSYAVPERLQQNNYKKLQNELRKNLKNQLGKIKIENILESTSVAIRIKHQLCDNAVKHKTVASNTISTVLSRNNTNNYNHTQQTTASEERETSNTTAHFNGRHSSLIEMFKATDPARQLSYAVYSDAYYEHGENSTLMYDCSNNSSNGWLTVSSSATTSDDDHHSYDYDEDEDEKTLCEGVKLLDNDISLRKGFDFLNNW